MKIWGYVAGSWNNYQLTIFNNLLLWKIASEERQVLDIKNGYEYINWGHIDIPVFDQYDARQPKYWSLVVECTWG